MNHKLNDEATVALFLKLDEWEAKHRQGPYESADPKPASKPSRIIWMLVGAVFTLIGYLIVI